MNTLQWDGLQGVINEVGFFLITKGRFAVQTYNTTDAHPVHVCLVFLINNTHTFRLISFIGNNSWIKVNVYSYIYVCLDKISLQKREPKDYKKVNLFVNSHVIFRVQFWVVLTHLLSAWWKDRQFYFCNDHQPSGWGQTKLWPDKVTESRHNATLLTGQFISMSHLLADLFLTYFYHLNCGPYFFLSKTWLFNNTSLQN